MLKLKLYNTKAKRALFLVDIPWFFIATRSHRYSRISSSIEAQNHHRNNQSSGFYPSSSIPFSLDLQNPRASHAFILKNGLESDSRLAIDLLLAYFVNGQPSISQSIFAVLFEANIYSLNSSLRELFSDGFFEQILNLYWVLRLSNGRADNFTFPYVLKACATLAAFEEGFLIHSQILKYGFIGNIFVANSLIDMYSKFGFLQSAREIFDEMPERNLVSWNCIISGYGLNGFPDTALELCSSLKVEGLKLDKVGLKIVLPACGQLGASRLGKSVHGHVIVSGSSSDTVLATAIMDMYAKCGNLGVAERLFNEITCKDVIAWNALISGYSQRGELEMVLKFFHKMQVEGVGVTVVTVLITLQACGDLASLITGEIIHGYITRIGLVSDTSVEALLINMYSKCGKLNLAHQVFRWISKEDVNSWSAIIRGLGMHGYGEATIMGFFKMLKKGIDPDGLCFLIVLSACSHTGMVKEGFILFDYMVTQFRVQPKLEHYVTMVDLMGRAGLVSEAFEFISSMPLKPDISIWGAFLGACRIHDDFNMAKLSMDQVLRADTRTPGYYNLIMSIYASRGAWEEVFKIRSLMEQSGVHKVSGHSRCL
ncbi:pentatricopeptide repeat-containing protein At1g08070, chloroplastic-like [Macadamia integrifolia]|uniref:pentatricopeptide repeat-containing protein At1g08070, chloroplastic-like n=1 Tax=Macadamia integrifolia TaxID=60698 RepID=UPI001C4EFCAD|nr:pentatricopeptide repeat-containing protein At1g08070, chloroplastic-like [Macadamia integrifolia]